MLDLTTASRGASLAEGETDDYALVRRMIEASGSSRRASASVPGLADRVGLPASQLGDLFARWAGSTPEAFLRAITPEGARELLRDSASVLDTVGGDDAVSGPARRYGQYVTHQAIAPGEDRLAGLPMSYGFHPSPFGEAIIVATADGLAGLGFVDNGERDVARADMQGRWPLAALTADQDATAPLAARAFDPAQRSAEAPLRLALIGTAFERRVWEVLLRVPMGRATTYSDIARRLGKPTAARAVGGAVGRNPISFVVPCHRVLGRSGAPTGYYWGLPRKLAMIGWEAGQTAEDVQRQLRFD